MKTHPHPVSGPLGVESRWTIHVAAGCLAVALFAAYGNSFSGPFVFDDIASIAANPTIHTLSSALSPPHQEGVTVGGRPLLNLSFALNYAISGNAVWSYHALNLLIHMAAALMLFGVIRRTLLRSALSERFGDGATPLALAMAALWALHPLQTESVTYTAQRAESLAGFFLLLTLYAFARAADRAGWLGLSVAACALGMATKEVMAVAPVLVLLYDRAFVAGSFRAAWRERRWFYFSLAATWLIVGGLAVGTGGRGGTAGFATPVSVWDYALTQCHAIVHYLRLAFWPRPLVFDYGLEVVRNVSAVAGPALILISLLGVTVIALVRWPRWGFLGAWFFAILAPSSSFVPVASQPMAEHRLYLPLAAVIAGLVLGGYAWLGRRSLWLWCGVAAIGATLTWRRNETYGSELALWSDTVVHAPKNARAHNNLGNALFAAGRSPEAIAHYQTAVTLAPSYADAENNLGRALASSGRIKEALERYEAALQTKPQSIEILMNYGSALAQNGRVREAIGVYERALAIEPAAAGVRYNLGNAQLQLGEPDAAVKSYEEAMRLDPTQLDARFNLAAALLRLNRPNAAMAQYEEILRRAPGDAATHAELANLLAHAGRPVEAVSHYETALRLQPDFPAARDELARLRAGGPPEK